MNKSIAFYTLGCKLNFSETSTLSRSLQVDGFVKKDFDDIADVYVINTCSVTDNADKECRMLVRRIRRRSPESTVVITGCYAQLKPQQIAEIKGVDLVLGAAEKFNLATHLKELLMQPPSGDIAKICAGNISEVEGFNSSFSINDRTRTFLKVQDGCNYNCSFCTIPQARGNSRSNTIDGVLENMRELATAGVQEIVLTGINLGDFGIINTGNSHKYSFFDLIQEMDKEEGIARIRISSIEPNLLSNEIIEFVAKSTKFVPHFHIPLQSGSNKILASMRRRYKKELYSERIALIKKLMPHCCIGADVIVGYPGETAEDFKETFNFIHAIDVSYLHVFTYSERDNTLATEMKEVVPLTIRQDRNKILRNLSYQKMQYFTESQMGTKRNVLFEIADKNGNMEGFTDNYIKVETSYRPEWVNKIVEWQL